MNKFNLVLDNLVYHLIVKNSDPLTFILPHNTPNTKESKKEVNEFKPANEIEVKVYVKTETDPLPDVVFVGQDDAVKIITNGSFRLLPDSVIAITFSTVDGGATWLVNSCSANGATAEGAETVAKKC